MECFIYHDVVSAPKGSKVLLKSSISNFGWIPNQSAIMAESPALLGSYQKAHELFGQCSLSSEERAVVWICSGIAHDCKYTIKAHEFIAKSEGVDVKYLKALRNGKTLPEKLEKLKIFTLKVATCQGLLKSEDVSNFISAGFTRAQVLEVILGVSQKTMSNMMNNISNTEIDSVFIEDVVLGDSVST